MKSGESDSGLQLAEELRRTEERVAKARAENAGLERRLLRSTATQVRVGLCVVAAGIAATVGFIAGAQMGARSATVVRGLAAKQHEVALGEEQATTHDCKATLERSRASLANCKAELARPRPSPPSTPCRCEPGDPLCSCL